ncbi:MAG: phosphoenolpyruvate--protein phosphotransferase [Actinomycetota bacterium]
MSPSAPPAGDGTVGIVLVSHSAALARGVAELAREVAGPGVVIVEAGGVAGGDGDVLGTDAVRVAVALDAAASSAGVLVIMDLGSAVLSAELALEMVDPALRDRVVLCDAPLVEGAVSAAVAARLGRPLAEVAAEARRGVEAKRAQLGGPEPEPEPGAGARGETGAAGGTGAEVTIVVDLPHGLHARPAARLVAALGPFDAGVAISNASTGKGPVDGRSLNGLALLGARRGHELVVRASGPDAPLALDAVVALAGAGFGEAGAEPALRPPPPAPPAGAGPGSLTGLAASPGIAVGPARHLRRPAPKVPTGRVATAAEEWTAFEHALDATRADLRTARRAVGGATGGGDAAALFDAHLLFLDDEALLGPTRRQVFGAGANAAEAWQGAVAAVAGAYRDLDDPYLRARGADVHEVGDRVLGHLLGEGSPVPVLAGAGVVVAAAASPRDLAALDPALVRGLATAGGGPLDHGAILARALGIPAVVGLGESVLAVPEGALVVLDGDEGVLRVDPGPEVEARFRARRAEADRRAEHARAAAAAPAVTSDGRRVLVAANIAGPAEITAALAAGADGVGLVRTEFLFLDRDEAPGEEEQAAAYAAMAAHLGGRPLVVRTLDAGADKDLRWLGGREPEANPALGVRGLRLGLARPDLLATQLRAVVRAAAGFPGIRLMFPMVTTADELRRARALLAQVTADLGGAGIAVPDRLEVGIMVEVPAAALAAAHLAAEAAFFSIGTNDLTQYALAADRGNPAVAPLADGLHPAVLRLVELVVAAGAGAGRPVAVCGALAADPAAVAVLVGLGVGELSVPPAAVPAVKEAVRHLDAGRAADLARRALAVGSAAEVRALAASTPE